jgi:hypothetical protein
MYQAAYQVGRFGVLKMKTKCLIVDGTTIHVPPIIAKKLLGRYGPEAVIEVSIQMDQERSVPQHRRYWGRLQEVAETLPEKTVEDFYQRLICDLKLFGCIDSEVLHYVLRKVCGVSSTSFCNMTHQEAQEYYRVADEYLSRWIGG